jgi:serine/threonine protein kinase
MELCCKTLINIIKQLNIELNQKQFEVLTPIGYYIASELFVEILESVNYLQIQKPPIIHRDLKPKNIVLTQGLNDRFVKIGDFGLAKIHEFEEQSHTERTGTLKYMAPEVAKHRK